MCKRPDAQVCVNLDLDFAHPTSPPNLLYGTPPVRSSLFSSASFLIVQPSCPLLRPTGHFYSLICLLLIDLPLTHLQRLKSISIRRQGPLSVPRAPTLTSPWHSSSHPHIIGVHFPDNEFLMGRDYAIFPTALNPAPSPVEILEECHLNG